MARSSRRFQILGTVALSVLGSSQAACTPGFYTMYPARLSAPVTPTTGAAATPSASAAPAGAIPYLTIRAYAHAENLKKQAVDVNHQLQVLNITASFTSPGATTPLQAVVMSIDVKSGNMHSSGGDEFFKALPVVVASQNAFNLTFTSTAVEENLADTFTTVLDVVSTTAGPLIATAAPQATAALSMATDILGKFQSGAKGTRFVQPETLNPTAGAMKAGFITGETRAMIIVPTGDSLTQGDVTAANQGSTPSSAATAYAGRIAELRKLKFALCAGDTTSLCTENATTNKQEPFDSYAYIMMVPVLSYRVTHTWMFWPGLTTNGSCQIDRSTVEKSIATRTLTFNAERLTSTQNGMEKEIEATALGLLSLRDAAAGSDKAIATTGVFKSLNSEWHRRTPTDALYTYADGAGPTYDVVRKTLRSCMLSEAATSEGILAHDYANTIEAASAALDEHDPAKQVASFNAALDGLYAVKVAFEAKQIEVKLEAQDITSIEGKLLKLQFAPLFADARGADAAKKKAALERIASLVAESPCLSCRTEALKIVKEVTAAPPASRDVLVKASDVSGDIAETRGALALATEHGGDKAPVSVDAPLAKRIAEDLAEAQRLTREAASSAVLDAKASPADASAKLDTAAKLTGGAKIKLDAARQR